MCRIPKSYFLCLLIFTVSIPRKVVSQWSFTPNYYQYDASVIGTNTVYLLLEDPYGFIWMVSDKGILIFNGKSYETIKIPGEDQEIVNICRYKNKVYASSYAGKLYEIDMLTLEVKKVSLPEPATSEATAFLFMNIIDNKLYLSKGQGAFLILDLKKNNQPVLISNSDYFLRYLMHHDLSKTDLRSHNLFKVSDDKLFMGDTIYELRSNTLNLFYTGGKRERFKKVSSYLQDGNDLYVGFLESGGLLRYTNYKASLDTNISQTLLSNVEVGDLLKDKNGNIWISTLHNGVFVLLKEKKEIQRLSGRYKLLSEDIWYVNYKNGILDIGYKQQVVDQIKKGLFYKRWMGDTTIHFNPVGLFWIYKDKSIIFGNRNTYIIDTRSNKTQKKTPSKDFYLHKEEIYATGPGALYKYSKELDHISMNSGATNSNGIKFNTFFPFSNSIYVKGGSTGLYVNDMPTKIRDRVNKVRVYNKDILACTDNGLYIKRGEKYFLINEKQGLPDNQCMQIEYFGDRYYKLLTKTGLAYIDKVDCKVAGSFDAHLLGSDVIIHHFDVENDTLWLATNKGIFTLNEHLILNKRRNNTSAYLYPDKITSRIMRYTEKALEFKYNEEKLVKMVIEILDFSPKASYLAYEIEKNNKIIAGPTQVADRSFYVSTPEPGNYTIKLSIGSDKNHVYQTLNYLLKITPLWHQTLWFRFTFGTFLAVALWLVIRWVIRYIVHGKEKRLKEQYAMLQLQSQAFFSQLSPHFIFNALTPLQSHILKNEKIKSLEYLDHFSSLMRDILKNSDKMEINLKKELDFIKKYVAIQQIRFTPPFFFEINIEPGIDQENISIPAMMLQPIVENAIEHGVKSKGNEGKIVVDINSIIINGTNCLQIRIADNGAGITQNVLKEGHALYILQKRVQTLQKREGIIASLTHEPRENESGTIFKLILPKTKNLWTP